MITILSISETLEGFSGYAEKDYYWIYYTITNSGQVTFDEKYLKSQYKGYTHFKNIIRKVEDNIKFLSPGVQVESLEFSQVEAFYCQRCV